MLLLLLLALMQRFWPASAQGWWLLVGVALSAQLLGQSLIAYALTHLPPTFGAVGLYVQVIAAPLLAPEPSLPSGAASVDPIECRTPQ